MKVSYEERVAIDFGLRRRCDCGNNVVLSVRTGGSAGQVLSSEILFSVCRPCPDRGKATSLGSRNGKCQVDTAESETLSMCGKSRTREPGGPINPKADAHHWGGSRFGGQGTALRVSLS
jgi:hypothetical protein